MEFLARNNGAIASNALSLGSKSAAVAPCPREALMSNARPHRSRTMLERLFVYGTLAPGRPNEHLLSAVPGTWQRGIVRGHLVQEGWGAEQGYPGVVVDESAGPVGGYVLTSEVLDLEWARLDQFEGTQYQRVLAQIELESGQSVEAYVYQLKR
jgi:gamma-glutamylcyclotransferase (GGCT)/AIG2-like uncharacterized protein YtfP